MNTPKVRRSWDRQPVAPVSSGGRRRDRGLVLLLTLVLIAIAAVAMAATARRSLAAALDAATAANDLQRRWAQVSIETTLLPRLDKLLAAAEKDEGEPQSSVSRTIRLGNLPASVRITDEQSSVNANTLIALRPRAAIEPTLTQLLRSAERTMSIKAADVEPLRLRIRPAVAKLTAYGQMFDRPSPEQMLAFRPPVTLWGDGRLHWRRADESALRALLEPEVGAGIVGQILSARDDEDLTLDRAIAQLTGTSDTVRRKAQRHLTDRSTCHGLWVVVSNNHRSWYTLTIAERGQTADAARGATPAARVHRLFW